MAQLSDDCFAFGGALLGVDAALALIADADHRRRRGARRCRSPRLPAASWRAILSPRIDVPPHANSAVDGFALAHADLLPDRDTVLPVGRPGRRRPSARPAGRARRGDPHLHRRADAGRRRHGDDAGGLRRRGRPGAAEARASARAPTGATPARMSPRAAVALPAGRRLRPADLGLAAALGHDELPVFRPLRVALLSTGDEVREPGAALPPGAIYDANRVMLAALAGAASAARSAISASARTAPAALADTLAAASAGHDLIVTSGGVSTGEEDHVRAAIEKLGRLDFWRLAIKPGRPVALGQVRRRAADRPARQPGRGGADLRDPGPAADPAARRRGRAAPPLTFPVRADFAYRKKPGPPRISARQPGARRRRRSSPANTRATAPASCPRSCSPTGS